MKHLTSTEPGRAPVALHDVAATRRLEAEAAAALPPHTLMQRAGLAVARLALAVAPHARRVWIVSGPGNNGGDGLEAATELRRLGKPVTVRLLGDVCRLPEDARRALERAQAAGVAIDAARSGAPFEPASLESNDLAIDALLGLGARRAPEGDIAHAITVFNALPCARLAIDLPSGLDADTGRALGAYCVRATHTLTLLTVKPGLWTGAGRDHAGDLWFDALGVDDPGTPPAAWLAPRPGSAPLRPHGTHKGSFGDVAVVAGAHGMAGAALLAARAAGAAGAGRVFVDLLDPSPALTVDTRHPELMLRPGWHRGDAAQLARSTVVCGCGGGAAVADALPTLLRHAGRLVLDADALNAIAAGRELAAALRERAARGQATVLTPHPLEAARLLGSRTEAVQAVRLAAARDLAERYLCVVVLKGSGSVIAAPGRVPWINATGNASLASAGTGDVLAGWLGGLWAAAEAMPSAAEGGLDATLAVALRAVASHGEAAEPGAPGALRASGLVEVLYRRLRAG